MTKEKNGKRHQILPMGMSLQMRILKTMTHYGGAKTGAIPRTEKKTQGIPQTQTLVRSRGTRHNKKKNGKKPSSLQKAMSKPHHLRRF